MVERLHKLFDFGDNTFFGQHVFFTSRLAMASKPL
jgi:hypothetical protein